MGLLDHRRTWRYRVNAQPRECAAAFTAAFSESANLFVRADWRVRQTGSGAVAIYQGRKGLGAVGGMFSRTQALEQDTAIGSEVTFEVAKSGSGRTECTMWLGSSGRAGVGGLLGATSDARFIRPYMQAVEKKLRALDPRLDVVKGLFGAELEEAPPSRSPSSAPPREAPRTPGSTATRTTSTGASTSSTVGRVAWNNTRSVSSAEGQWTCPACGYAKNMAGRVRCVQCRRDTGGAQGGIS